MSEATNPNHAAIERAMDVLRQRRGHLFLTGRAGTGKTFFLEHARRALAGERNIAVVAPSGVAAIKAGGKTIHSFFRIRPQAYAPGGPELTTEFSHYFRLSSEQRQVLKGLDLLFIDEVSMVRADLLDVVDTVLRHFRHNDAPFGGVQLCLIGDAFQLPPVVTDSAERALLDDHYSSLFFFAARCFQRAEWTAVELPTVMRQRDRAFVDVLNRLRLGQAESADLAYLNTRVISTRGPAHYNDERVLLTAKRAEVDRRNRDALLRLPGPTVAFAAEVAGTFNSRDFPTEQTLRLKVGALVMFLRNDPEQLYYNGRLGVVDEIGEGSVTVVTGTGQPVEITRHSWQNVRYGYDRAAKRLTQEKIGTFNQLPLRLAYAITIHKSQGLTLDSAVVDLQSSFSAGMAYVALSRVRAFGGLLLTAPVTTSMIAVSPAAVAFQQWVDDQRQQAGGDAGAKPAVKRQPRFPPPPAALPPQSISTVGQQPDSEVLHRRILELEAANAQLRERLDAVRRALKE